MNYNKTIGDRICLKTTSEFFKKNQNKQINIYLNKQEHNKDEQLEEKFFLTRLNFNNGQNLNIKEGLNDVKFPKLNIQLLIKKQEKTIQYKQNQIKSTHEEMKNQLNNLRQVREILTVSKKSPKKYSIHSNNPHHLFEASQGFREFKCSKGFKGISSIRKLNAFPIIQGNYQRKKPLPHDLFSYF